MHVVYWESHVFFRFSAIATNVNFTDAYGITKTILRKKQNIGLLWAKVRMFCSKSTDVFIEKVRCFYFPERELHNLNAVFKPFRGHIHHVQLYIKNMVFLLFRETWMPLMVHQLLELSNRCCPFTIDAVPVAII